MGQDRLEELLRRADEAGGPGGDAGDLAGRVRRLARRRRAAAVAAGLAGAAAMVLVGAMAIFREIPPSGHPGPQATGDSTQQGDAGRQSEVGRQVAHDAAEVQRIRARIAALSAQAEARTLVVERLLAAERCRNRMSALSAASTFVDARAEILQQMELAAATLVHHGERLHRELDLPRAAASSFRRVMELFPQTQSAETARRRLEEMGPVNDLPQRQEGTWGNAENRALTRGPSGPDAASRNRQTRNKTGELL